MYIKQYAIKYPTKIIIIFTFCRVLLPHYNSNPFDVHLCFPVVLRDVDPFSQSPLSLTKIENVICFFNLSTKILVSNHARKI